MSTNRFFQSNSISMAGYNGYGSAAKAIVNLMLSTIPGLAVNETVSDTASKYDVYVYHPRSNRVRYHIYNNNGNLNIDTQICKVDGSWYSTSVSVDDCCIYGDSYSVTVHAWGIGDWLIFWQVNSSRGYRGFGAYTYITDASGSVEIPLMCSERASSSSGTVPMSFWPSNWFTYDDYSKTYGTMSFSSDTSAVSSAAKYANIPFVLYPYNIHAYFSSGSMGFVNVKWGGAYTLYLLYNVQTGSIVQQTPGSYANVNGTNVQSLGYVFLAM